jgi:hypothetical protein
LAIRSTKNPQHVPTNAHKKNPYPVGTFVEAKRLKII